MADYHCEVSASVGRTGQFGWNHYLGWGKHLGLPLWAYGAISDLVSISTVLLLILSL
jgi:hypothetical protein